MRIGSLLYQMSTLDQLQNYDLLFSNCRRQKLATKGLNPPVGEKRELDTKQSGFCRGPSLFTKSVQV